MPPFLLHHVTSPVRTTRVNRSGTWLAKSSEPSSCGSAPSRVRRVNTFSTISTWEISSRAGRLGGGLVSLIREKRRAANEEVKPRKSAAPTRSMPYPNRGIPVARWERNRSKDAQTKPNHEGALRKHHKQTQRRPGFPATDRRPTLPLVTAWKVPEILYLYNCFNMLQVVCWRHDKVARAAAKPTGLLPVASQYI